MGVADGCGGLEEAGIKYLKHPESSGHMYGSVPGAEGVISRFMAIAVGDCGDPEPHSAQVTRVSLAFVRDGKVYWEGLYDPSPGDIPTPLAVCAGPVDLTTPGWTATDPTM